MQRVDGRLAAIEQRMAAAMFTGQTPEVSLADLFGDPLTRVLMAADRVDYCDLEALLRRKRAQLDISPG